MPGFGDFRTRKIVRKKELLFLGDRSGRDRWEITRWGLNGDEEERAKKRSLFMDGSGQALVILRLGHARNHHIASNGAYNRPGAYPLIRPRSLRQWRSHVVLDVTR